MNQKKESTMHPLKLTDFSIPCSDYHSEQVIILHTFQVRDSNHNPPRVFEYSDRDIAEKRLQSKRSLATDPHAINLYAVSRIMTIELSGPTSYKLSPH